MLELPGNIEQEESADNCKIDPARRVSGGRSVQQREQRVPLRDCTNTPQFLQQESQLKHSGPSKGQWKRRARLQGQNGTAQLMEPNVPSEETYRKRWRDHSDRNSDTDPDIVLLNQAVKKGKKVTDTSYTKDSEVEATSRDWS